MKILCVGGGPSSAYFSILMKKYRPETEITLVERNPANCRSGWGVIIPDSLFSLLQKTDSESFRYVDQNAMSWNQISVVRDDKELSIAESTSRAISRHDFTNFLLARAQAVGSTILRPMMVESAKSFDSYDLVVWGDGAHSYGRANIIPDQGMSKHLSKNRFIWLGTKKIFGGMSFIFKTTSYGPIWAHAYPFEQGLSTFIVECTPTVFDSLGFSQLSVEESAAIIGEIFRKELHGQELLALKSGGHWRQFLQVHTRRLVKDNHVIVGDAAHTAHFSIGSGTRMAVEDAFTLSKNLVELSDVQQALDIYSNQSIQRALEIQRPALNSMKWFDAIEDYFDLDMPNFFRALMFRSAYAPADTSIENLSV